MSTITFGVSGHEDCGYAGVHQIHVSEEFEEALLLPHLAMSHEHVCHLVTFFSHVHVVAQLLHSRLQNICEARGVLCEVVGDVGNCAIVVVDGRDIDVGVPGDDPLRIVVVDEDLINVTSQEDFTSFPGLLHNCPPILVVSDRFLPPY